MTDNSEQRGFEIVDKDNEEVQGWMPADKPDLLVSWPEDRYYHYPMIWGAYLEKQQRRVRAADAQATENVGSAGLQKAVDGVKFETPIGGLQKVTVTARELATARGDLDLFLQNRPRFGAMTLNERGDLVRAMEVPTEVLGRQVYGSYEEELTHCVSRDKVRQFLQWLEVVFELKKHETIETVEQLVEFLKQFRTYEVVVSHPKLRDALDAFFAEMEIIQ